MGCLKDLFEAGSQLPAGEYLTTLPLRGVYEQTLFGKKPLLTKITFRHETENKSKMAHSHFQTEPF